MRERITWESHLRKRCTTSRIPPVDGIIVKSFYERILYSGGKKVPEEKVIAGYCGMHCDACAIHTGEMKAAISRLRELVGLYEIARVAQLLGGIGNFPQFLKTLDELQTVFGRCGGCRTGGGWSGCPMRKCCSEKCLKSCYECQEMPCKELVEFQRKHLLTPAPHYRR